MGKSTKKFEKHIFDDEKNEGRKSSGHRHSKLNKYNDEDEYDYDFDEDFKYADEVKHFLKK